jgi:hypothetical protein
MDHDVMFQDVQRLKQRVAALEFQVASLAGIEQQTAAVLAWFEQQVAGPTGELDSTGG